jgi:hydroxymethylpyrimidine kinase/phosphomethylpyrimidine kinase
MKHPCALTIAGSDSGGGAGIQADIKTFAALGVHGLCVLTAVTAQNTQGVDATFELPPEFVTKQFDTIMRDFKVKWAKTGMLGSADIIRAVEAGIKRYKLRVVIDPVMTSATGAPLIQKNAIEALVALLGCAELVTPNVPEAELLSGIKIKSRADMRRVAHAIAKLGPRAVLIKGGHMKGREIVDLLYTEKKITEFKGPRITTEQMHGTGCSLASAITAELAKGSNIEEAVSKARDFIAEAIKGRLDVGKGVKPVGQFAALFKEAEKNRITEEVWTATQLLANDKRFHKLLPEVGSNIAMALPDARTRNDIVGLSGRIVRVGDRAHITGFPILGGSEHVANIVLTAMRYNPKIRAGLNIRFSEEALRACRRLGLRVSEFSRGSEPLGAKTMVWGTRQVIKKAGGVPDVIFDRGARGKEAMIRLLGKSATEVAKRALKISKFL